MLKKLALTMGLFAISTASFADATGWYAGLNVGGGQFVSSSESTYFENPSLIFGTDSQKKHTQNYTARINLGFQYNKYFATELGYSYFPQITFHNLYGTTGATGKVQTQTLDFYLKPILPLSIDAYLFGLAGAAYVNNKASVNSTAKKYNYAPHTQNDTKVSYGIGAGYYFWDYWSAELTYRRISGSTSHNIPNVNVATIGVTFHFHDPDDYNDF